MSRSRSPRALLAALLAGCAKPHTPEDAHRRHLRRPTARLTRAGPDAPPGGRHPRTRHRAPARRSLRRGATTHRAVAAPKPTAANVPARRIHAPRDAAAPSSAWRPTCATSSTALSSQNQPVTLHLAAIPRVPGTNLKVSVKQVDGLSCARCAGDAEGRRRGRLSAAIVGDPRAAAPAQHCACW